MKLSKQWTQKIFTECYCVARKKPIRNVKTTPQTETVISLWFWGLLACPELCDWWQHNQHSQKFWCSRFSEFDSKKPCKITHYLSRFYSKHDFIITKNSRNLHTIWKKLPHIRLASNYFYIISNNLLITYPFNFKI